MYAVGTNLTLHLTGEEAPYALHGKFVSQNEEGILIEGTVGNNIGAKLYVPWANVKYIQF
jgi:hypothetical protein